MQQFKVGDIVQSDCGYIGELVEVDTSDILNPIYYVQVDRVANGEEDYIMLKKYTSQISLYIIPECVNPLPW